LSRIVAILAPALAWVGGSMVAAKAAQAGDDAPRSREEIVELVLGSADGRSRVEYVLDPSAGWLPRRHQVFSGDALVLSREVHEFHAIGSGAFLPVRATERNISQGVTVEFEVKRDAEGNDRAGILADATTIAAAPAGAVLAEE
jgi:hypothetical protein